jgi:hypothetical protein
MWIGFRFYITHRLCFWWMLFVAFGGCFLLLLFIHAIFIG